MELMRELSLAPGVSGSEEEVAKIITRELEDVADKIEKDSMGNLIATKKGEKKAPTVMLAAHMDEIGLMVRYIDDNGFIKFSTIGGINDQMLMNQTVTVHSSVGEPVVGVIGSKPPHVTTAEEKNKVVKSDDMFIDIGAKDKEEAEKMVRIGDKMTFNSLFVEYPSNLIMGKALDNRVGCYVMIEVLKRVNTRATVYGVGTVQEEDLNWGSDDLLPIETFGDVNVSGLAKVQMKDGSTKWLYVEPIGNSSLAHAYFVDKLGGENQQCFEIDPSKKVYEMRSVVENAEPQSAPAPDPDSGESVAPLVEDNRPIYQRLMVLLTTYSMDDPKLNMLNLQDRFNKLYNAGQERYLSETTGIDLPTLAKIAEVLGVTPEELTKDVNDSENKLNLCK